MQWAKLLEDSGIEYVSRGPNTKKGEISVKCPWCGEDDPSQHMGISLGRTRWGCLRNAEHRGTNPIRLIKALLGCSHSYATMVKQQYDRADPSDLEEALQALGESPLSVTINTNNETFPNVHLIRYRGITSRFYLYLKDRGFDDIKEVTWRYNIKACLSGQFKDRVIIPFMRRGKIIAWTGRAIIDPVFAPRYLSSEQIKTTVFNEDVLLCGGQLLFITEGPFDAIKLDYYAMGRARATCTSGTTVSMDQIALLKQGLKNFRRVVLLFDHDAWGQAFLTMDWLNGPNVVLGTLPQGVKDPGDLSPPQIEHLTQTYTGAGS